jgi:starch phosphorylase
MSGQQFTLEVNPKIPNKLSRLPELANDLWYSWHKPTRALFQPLNPSLWKQVRHNPKLFLRSIDEQSLKTAAEDQAFLASYNQVLSAYDTYHKEKAVCASTVDFAPDDLIAYFCAEYGFHESFPVYSGGLGILAGDHCKTASDLGMPFVGVGLLYRQGYFSQHIDGEGNQVASYHESRLDDLPVSPARDSEGREVHVVVEFPGRDARVKVWEARVGHVTLYLMDTNVPENTPDDRAITHKLYGGDMDMRMRQEIILGIGGVRVLRRLGLKPTVWHINEGHAAFLIIERIRQQVAAGLDFATAREMVAAKTVFTTHTPVPAGHDVFPEGLVMGYFEPFLADLGVSRDEFLALGRMPHRGPEFNMTTLAITGSRHHNGVSQIHGRVSAEICADCWPQIPPAENPMGYVTNGVHVPTFLAQAWSDLFDRFLGAAWRNHLSDVNFWERVDEIPDHLFWSVKQSIKSQLFYSMRECLLGQHLRNQVSEVHLERMTKFVDPSDPNVLTIGFARRFATYKRAPLLAQDLDWLREILGDAERPVVFVFAGKAHPADIPGQDYLKQIHELSTRPEFVGKILLVEGYDLALARRLVSGVDVWLNNPIYPLEASGTSGIKAAVNGTVNLSVLDGWWAEGYDGANGWAIRPSPYQQDEARRDYEDARTLYEILQDEVIPLYHARGKHGYSPAWVQTCKRSMGSILPRFNMCRVLNEYAATLYLPAARQCKKLCGDDYQVARELAEWKRRVAAAWPGVSLRRLDESANRIQYGQTVNLSVAVQLNGLEPKDVTVELLLSRRAARGDSLLPAGLSNGDMIESGLPEVDEQVVADRFRPNGTVRENGECHYSLELQPEWCGRLSFRVRAFPLHRMLTHPHETGLMVWL